MAKTARMQFDEMDTDVDGFVTLAELKQALINNPKVTDEHVSKVMTFFDENLDRMISFTEFEPHARVE